MSVADVFSSSIQPETFPFGSSASITSCVDGCSVAGCGQISVIRSCAAAGIAANTERRRGMSFRFIFGSLLEGGRKEIVRPPCP